MAPILMTILNVVRVPDGQGGWVEGFTEINERGYLRPASAREVSVGGQAGAAVSHIAMLRRGAPIAVGDRVRCQSVEFDVIALRNPGFTGRFVVADLLERR